jgi:hypothetical protein
VILFDVSVRRDGHTGTGVRHYPPGNGQLPERERDRAVYLAHRFHCRDRLSFRATQAALARAGIRRSVGQIHKDIVRYVCDICDGPPQQPAPPANGQQPGPAAVAGSGWAGPAPA